MSGYEIQDAQGTTLFEGETFSECVEVVRGKALGREVRIVAVLCTGEEVL